MKPEEFALWIQAAAVVVAVGASLVALTVSWRDRANARFIADLDRRASLKQAKLLFDLDVLMRLLDNLNRGGSTDPKESARMGSEALTLIGLLSAELLPTLWETRVGHEDKLQRHHVDPEFPQYKRNAIEVQLAINRVLAEIRELSARI